MLGMLPLNATVQQSTTVELQLSDLLHTPPLVELASSSTLHPRSDEAAVTTDTSNEANSPILRRRAIAHNHPDATIIPSFRRLFERIRNIHHQFQHAQETRPSTRIAIPEGSGSLVFESAIPSISSRPNSRHFNMPNFVADNHGLTLIRRDPRYRLFRRGRGHGRVLFRRRNSDVFSEPISDGQNSDSTSSSSNNAVQTHDDIRQVPPLELTPGEQPPSASLVDRSHMMRLSAHEMAITLDESASLVSPLSLSDNSTDQIGERLRREHELPSHYDEADQLLGDDTDSSALERYHRGVELDHERSFNILHSMFPRLHISPVTHSSSLVSRAAAILGTDSPTRQQFRPSEPFRPNDASVSPRRLPTPVLPPPRRYSLNDGFFNRTRRSSISARFRPSGSSGYRSTSQSSNRLRRSNIRISNDEGIDYRGPIINQLLQDESAESKRPEEEQEPSTTWSRGRLSLKHALGRARDLYSMLGNFEEADLVGRDYQQSEKEREQKQKESGNISTFGLVLDDEMMFETLKVSPISSTLLDFSNI